MIGFISLVSGFIFGLGLIISGMTQPGKVIGFLNFIDTEQWQWDLMGVMGGALIMHALTRLLVLRRKSPILEGEFPTFRMDIDQRLIIGSAIFGLGWGTAGFCPGPALVSLVTLDESVIVFVITMTLGMLAAHLVPTNHNT